PSHLGTGGSVIVASGGCSRSTQCETGMTNGKLTRNEKQYA
ncbi:unnamed protein product, partial [Mycena citricolor]